MKGKTVFLSTALAGALAAASSVHAVDVKVYPGSACQAIFGNEAAALLTSAFIRNRSTTTRFVVCPIVRDNHSNLNGVQGAGVQVRSPKGTSLTCVLATFTTGGVLVASDTKSTTSKVVTNLPLDINASTNNGTYSLFCDLPSLGEVHGYRVTEF